MTGKPRRSIATPDPLGKLRRGTGREQRARDGPRPDRAMRLLTINLLHGGFLPWFREDRARTAARLTLLADELARLRPDVIAVQEALVASAPGAVATWLAGRLGYQVRFATANPFIIPPPVSRHIPRAPARAHRPRHRGGARFRRGQRRLDDAPHRRTRRASSSAAEPAARESRRPPRAPRGTVRPARRLERAPDPRGQGAPPAGGCTGRPHRSRVRGSSRGPPRRLQRHRGGCRDARSRRGRVPRRLPPGPRFGSGAVRLAARRFAGPDCQPACRLLLSWSWHSTLCAIETR